MADNISEQNQINTECAQVTVINNRHTVASCENRRKFLEMLLVYETIQEHFTHKDFCSDIVKNS